MKCALVTRNAQEKIKFFNNSRSLQKCCSLVYPFTIILKLSCSMNYDGRVLHATTIILDSGDLSWSCRKKKRSCQKKELCRKKKFVPEKTDVVKKKLDEKNQVALTQPPPQTFLGVRHAFLPFHLVLVCYVIFDIFVLL